MESPPPPPPPPANLPPPPPPPGYVPAAYPPQPQQVVIPPPVYAPQPMGGEQVRYAGFWIRFAAVLIDSAILLVVWILTAILFAVFIGVSAMATGSEPDFSSAAAGLLGQLIRICIYGGYFIYFWGMGQTPGMRRYGLYVADANTGRAIGFGRAGLRLLGYAVSSVVCYVGLIWAAFDPRKRGWHDYVAGTVVFFGD